jgi:hypothetical protein
MSIITDKRLSAIVAAVALLGVVGRADAAEPPPTTAPVEGGDAALAALQRRVEALEQANQKLAAERKRAPTVTLAPGAGFSITTSDGRFSFGMRARSVVRDTVTVPPNAPTTNELLVKTLRLFAFGNVLDPELKYFIQLAFANGDFEAGNPSPIFDAFVEYGRWRDVRLRVGQYFVPFDRARTIREFALQFVDRQQVVQELALDRDVGLTAYSNDVGGLRGRLGYAVGIFAGEGKNRFGGQSPGFLYVARFIIRPWGNFDDDQEGDLERLRRPRMAIGLAGAFNQAAVRSRSTTGSTFSLGGYDYVHGAADLVFKFAGFSLLTEFLVRRALWNNRVGVDDRMMPLTEWSRSAYGYLVQAGMMVHRLVEVAGRWEQLFAWPDTDPALVKLVSDAGHQVGGGLNLYLNGHLFKFQADYFYQFGDIPSNGRHQVRVQLDTTF